MTVSAWWSKASARPCGRPADYDLVIWPLRESFQGVAAGTFGLRETYALTRDALADGWRALAPNGRLVVTRWLQATPSESVRMWASLLDALRQAGVADPAAHVLAWRSLEVVTMVASPTAFTPEERRRSRTGSRATDSTGCFT